MIQDNAENRIKMTKVAESICGTCHSLESELESEFQESDVMEFETGLLHVLDDITIMCEGCNWYCETDELDDDCLCGDCR